MNSKIGNREMISHIKNFTRLSKNTYKKYIYKTKQFHQNIIYRQVPKMDQHDSNKRHMTETSLTIIITTYGDMRLA